MSDDDDDEPTLISRRAVLQVSAAALAASGTLAGPTLTTPAGAQPATITVAGYILKRLSQRNVKHLFGVPGATCDPLFLTALTTDVVPIITASDGEAGYAADGYARRRGLGAVSVTRGVGTLGLANAIAGAYAERSPVVLINGGPSAAELATQQTSRVLYSHSAGRHFADANAAQSVDFAVFKALTALAVRADRAAAVPALVDQAIRTALTEARPVYIEIASAIWGETCAYPVGDLATRPAPSGREADLARKILDQLQTAAKPLLLLGIEIDRYGLAAKAAELVRALGLRYTTTLLAKAVIAEDTPGFIGVHDGDRAHGPVKAALDGSDLVLSFGCVFGSQYRDVFRRISPRLIRVGDGEVTLPRATPVKAELGALIDQLLALRRSGYGGSRVRTPLVAYAPLATVATAPAGIEAGLTYDQVMAGVNGFLDATFVTLTDTSLSMYTAGDLRVTGANAYLANAVWQSIGYSAAAALGVALAGNRRPLVICGDGGFQMTAHSLSSLVRYQVPAIVIVLDNGLYGIEQYLLAPGYFRDAGQTARPYLKLNGWNYADLAKAMGVGLTRTVDSPQTLTAALTQARGATGPALIQARIRPHDLPSELRPV